MVTQKFQWGNRSYEFFKVSTTPKQKGLAAVIGSIGFIVPDMSISLIAASCVLSPIGFKKALQNKLFFHFLIPYFINNLSIF